MKRYLFVFPAFSLFFFFCSCSEKTEKPVSTAPAVVQAQEVIQKTVPVYIDSFGTLTASQDVNLVFRVSGQIEKIYFKEGSLVKKGDVIISLNPEMYELALKRDKAALDKDVADLQLQQFFVNKNSPLAQTGAMASQNYETMKINLAKAIATVKEDETTVLSDELNLKYCTISSPIDGVMGITKMDVGNFINPSVNLTPVANIKNINPLYIDFMVSASNIPRLRDALAMKDLVVFVYVKKINNKGNLQTEKFVGSLEFLNNTASITSGTVSLRAIVPNPQGKLLPGQFANVRLIVCEKPNALLVPRNGVKVGPVGHYIFVVTPEGKAEIKNIKIGQKHGKYFVVEKGSLKVGEQVITTGLLNLAPGIPVKVMNITP